MNPVMLMFALPIGVPRGVAFNAMVSGGGGGEAGAVVSSSKAG
jgi:hypothetical protein